MTQPPRSPHPAKPATPARSAPPPRPVDLARWLFILSAVVGAIRFLVQLSDRPMLIGELRRLQPTLGQDELDAAATGGIVFGLIIGVGMVLVYVLLANRMAAGRNWARVVLTVLASAGVFLGLLRLVSAVSGFSAASGLPVSGVDLAFGVVTMALDLTAVVLVFQGSAAGHFRPRPIGSRR
ncbi:MAG: hypothetical protein HOV94_23110 [Saccharothrix sp.]|nr:hypothetical protein [Saccharothrix sp.]